jgi:hypothetical protein
MPSLLVQLDRAARGTGVDIREMKVTPQAEGSSGSSGSTPPAGGSGPGAGGNGAQSQQGKAAENAGNTVNDANAKNGANAAAANGATPGAAPQSAPGLAAVGLSFKIDGDFFSMADFFHRMKRFVRVANDQVVVRGRLLSIDNFAFSVTEQEGFSAEVSATAYLSPKAAGGVDAGASPSGPSSSPGGGNVAADPSQSTPPTAAAPTP